MEENILDTEVQSVGELLRNARLKQGKTLGDVADELCIRKFYLNAIENMDMDKMPPMPYSAGFVRSYAKYLGLNSERVVSSYRQSMGKEIVVEAEEDEKSSVAAGPRKKHLFIALCGFALLFIAWNYSDLLLKTLDGENEANLKSEESVAEISVENNVPIIENEEAESSTQENTEMTEDTSSNVETDVPQTEEPVTKPQMKIVLVGPSWLELKQGDEVLLSGVYNKGFSYDVPNEEDIIISVGRHYNVKFYIDGKQKQVVSAKKRVNVKLDDYLK